ncbi:MAG: hypothetical protein AAFX06_31040 [Planctomycetota bacterium]
MATFLNRFGGALYLAISLSLVCASIVLIHSVFDIDFADPSYEPAIDSEPGERVTNGYTTNGGGWLRRCGSFNAAVA